MIDRYISAGVYCYFLLMTVVGVNAQSLWLRKQLTINDGYRKSYFVASADTNHIFYVPADKQGKFGHHPMYTTDYGVTWTSIMPDKATLPWSITGIVYPSPDLILLACNNQYYKQGTPEYDVGHLVRSTDGGISWTDRVLGVRDTTITDFQLRLRASSPIGAITALDKDHIFAATVTSHYLHSSDGGATWDSIQSPVSDHWQGHYMAGNPIVNPLAAYTAPNTIVVAEVDSLYPFANYVHKVYRTTNLGKSWSSGFQLASNLTALYFTSPMTGFATGYILDHDTYSSTVTIDKTTDGGISWFTIYYNRFPFTMGLRGIAFADSLYGIAAGDGGVVLHTTNGGATWEQMTTDVSVGDSAFVVFGGVIYPSRTRAMIASSTGEILIYNSDTLLDMPNITYPKYAEVVPKNITITWDDVAGALRYKVLILFNGLTIVDTTINDTYFHFSDSLTRQYDLYVTALNDKKTSNPAHRIIRFWNQADVQWRYGRNQYLYLSFSPSSESEAISCTVYGLYSVRDMWNIDMRIYDLLGREQINMTEKLRGKHEPFISFNIPISSFLNGLYVGVLRTSNGFTSGKFVVVR